MSDKESLRTQNEQLLKKEAGVKLDGTININTLITVGTLLVSGALAYAAIDKRVTILEQLASERYMRVDERLRELQREVKELSTALNAARKDKQ